MTGQDASTDAVATLQRWEDAGAIWRVLRRSPDQVEVSLLTCTGGEEVDRWVSSDPALLRFLGDRRASDE